MNNTINERIKAEVVYRIIKPRQREYGTRSISDTIERMHQDIIRLEKLNQNK